LAKVKELHKDGQRTAGFIIKNDNRRIHDRTLPVSTLARVGSLLLPVLAAVGALAALVLTVRCS